MHKLASALQQLAAPGAAVPTGPTAAAGAVDVLYWAVKVGLVCYALRDLRGVEGFEEWMWRGYMFGMSGA
jgi:hypothetical protein